MNQELIQYIADAKNHGLSEMEIKQNLLDAGWDAAAVEEAFTHAKVEESKASEVLPSVKTQPIATASVLPVEVKNEEQITPAEPGEIHTSVSAIVGQQAPGITESGLPVSSGVFGQKRNLIIASAIAVVVLAVGGFFAYGYFQKNGGFSLKSITDAFSKKAKNVAVTIKGDAVYQNNFKISYHDPLSYQNSENSFGGDFFEKLKDFTVSFEGKFYIDSSKKDSPESSSNVKYTFGSGNTTFSTGLEYRLINKAFYVNVGDNPFLSTIANEALGEKAKDKKINWIKLDTEELQNKLKDGDEKDYESMKEFFDPSLRNDLSKLWEDAKLVKVDSTVGKETINGISTIHYKNKLDKEALKKFLSDYIARLGKAAGEEVTESDINQGQMVINALVDKLEIKEFETWIGADDYHLYKVHLLSNAPSLVSIINQLSGGNTKVDYNSSDYKRISDIGQYKWQLSDYKTQYGGYPAAKDGNPVGMQPIYYSNFDTGEKQQDFHLTPPTTDGNCTDYYNAYWYEPKGESFVKDGKTLYPDYQVTFCLGSETADYSGTYQAGVARLIPSGIEDNITCPTTAQQCYKDPSKDNGDHNIAKRKEKRIKDMVAKIDYSAEFRIDADYHEYGKKVQLDVPADAYDILSALGDARAESRDAKRLADIKQLSSALELYFNDKSEYPKDMKDMTPMYIGVIPTAPMPNDGACSPDDNSYHYSRTGASQYSLTFCLGVATGGYTAGKHTLTQSGIQ